MILDPTVYPDLEEAPADLPEPGDKADYVHRLCSAFDFGIFPWPEDWRQLRGWKQIFDAFPLPHSPAYHTFRWWYGWEPVPAGSLGVNLRWQDQDLREGRTDPCEHMV